MEQIDKKELEQVSGGAHVLNETSPRCPNCQSNDIKMLGQADIGTPPSCKCNTCGYEWMMLMYC